MEADGLVEIGFSDGAGQKQPTTNRQDKKEAWGGGGKGSPAGTAGGSVRLWLACWFHPARDLCRFSLVAAPRRRFSFRGIEEQPLFRVGIRKRKEKCPVTHHVATICATKGCHSCGGTCHSTIAPADRASRLPERFPRWKSLTRCSCLEPNINKAIFSQRESFPPRLPKLDIRSKRTCPARPEEALPTARSTANQKHVNRRRASRVSADVFAPGPARRETLSVLSHLERSASAMGRERGKAWRLEARNDAVVHGDG